MFRKTFIYCRVQFDDEKTYWYRTNEHGYKSGMKVIVPVSNNGLWKIGTITEVQKFDIDNVPYPLIRTKGIVEKAGFFAQSKVDSHNKEIERSKYPPIDISIADVKTSQGRIVYCTCKRERDLHRELLRINKEPFITIENYPLSAETDIPLEARRELERRIKGLQKRKLDKEIDFMEMMEDLDQYN